MADQLSLDLEDFLPIVETAQMLQFATIHQGDIELTDMGYQFADASVLLRKEIFKAQVLQHVPMFEKILWILQSKSNNKMEREFFEEIVQKHFGDEEAAHSLEHVRRSCQKVRILVAYPARMRAFPECP